MAAIGATTLGIAAAARPRAQLRVARAGTFRCAAYSNEGVKVFSATNLSLAVLKRMKAMEVRSSSSRAFCDPAVVEEPMDTKDTEEDTRIQRLSRALSPEAHWLLACVLGYFLRR